MSQGPRASLTWLSTENNIKLLDPSLASPFHRRWLRRLTRLLLWLATLAYFSFAVILLTLRYAVLPQIENYRGDIEQMLSSSMNLPVAIASIDTHWQDLLPHLELHGLQVHDQQGRPALAFDNVVAEISWTSLLYFNLRLQRLEIVAPTLTVRRDVEGRIFIAGLQLNTPTPQNQNNFSDWLLAQHRVVVRDASITWVDELRGAAPLELQHLNFHLQNEGSRHRFGLTADPPQALAARLDVRGDFTGEDLDELGPWKGETYAELDYADLSAWRQWVDYPVELPQGSGAMRLWLGFAEKQLASATADIAMDNVQIRLAKDLPLLDLQNLNGRLSGMRLPQGLELSARHLALTTRDGIRVAPSDFQLHWSEAAGRTPALGAFSADGLDLGALARLAVYLPLPAAMRQQLADVAPRGKVFDLKSSWSRPDNAGGIPTSYSLNARFERLGMNAQGALPGFEGVTGSIDGNEQGGAIKLASHDAALELPKIFAEPHIDLAVLNLQTRWKVLKEKEHEKVEVVIEQAAFENRDAAGVASGRYVGSAGEPGEIDLNARLSRGNGNAVWRYIPLAVGKDVRDWLQASILGGVSNDTALRLKGDLLNFPFADGSGIFEVKGKFHGAALRYVSSWPQIDNITGELAFVGKHMLIKASSGSIYGVALSDVKAEIADLAARDNSIFISGGAHGPTGDFLRFIETSPVGAAIDHFTEDMTASGNGHLNLKLQLPLQHLADSRIEGAYQFAGNRLKIDADLPPLTEVNGRLQFTGNTLKAERVRAMLLGMPMAFDVKTAGNGSVTVNADGTLNIIELRKQFTHPLLDHLSGSTVWRGSVLARKKNADVLIESKLQGLSSSLPMPFNKSVAEALPLRFERKLLPKPLYPASGKSPAVALAAVPHDQIDLSLGNAVAARFIRRHEGERAEKVVWERGAIAIGETLTLPDKGLLLAVNLPRIDVDYWRSLLPKANGDGGGAPAELPLAFTALTLKTPELMAFGHSLNDLDARASYTRDGGWHGEIKSRDLNGELNWRGQGSGRLSGHLKQLVINVSATPTAASDKPTAGNMTSAAVDEMPGLDIEVDQFLLHGKPLGRLKLIADNHDGTWDARLDIENDDGKLSGEGKWRPNTSQPDAQIKFTLNVKSIEKMLARLAYTDAVRHGRATLEGNLSWNGAPYALDYPSLNGTLKLDAANGQFNKLEPGVGRLLGILSLQSLPRRITLDFRDIFSEGLAFDSITGQVNLNRGVMDTQNLQIQGPAAKVLMSGSVSLPQETQNLKVRVQPAIGESLAIGAMFANPAAGAIAWLAQKILRDPLDQAFAFEYAITGTWVDPKVTKLSGPQPKPENPESAARPN